MVNRTYIIARDYAQYRQWCWDNGYNPRDLTVYYVKDQTSLYGLGWNDFEIVYLNGWTSRPDAGQIALAIDAMKRANGSTKGRRKVESGLFTWTFWKRTLERMIRAFASSLLAVVTMDGFNLLTASWGAVLAAAATASFVSLIVSVIGSQFGSSTDPSLVR
jgi:hypothetical protein